MIDAVSRSMYKIDKSDISFDYHAKLKANTKLFEKYNKRVWQLFKLYKENQKMTLPSGTLRFNNTDINNKITLVGVTITPTSSLYPSEQLEGNVFKLIGQAGLDISLCRSDSLSSGPCSSQNADLSFSTETIKPTLTYWFSDSTIEIEANDLKPSKQDLSWRNKGGIESLVDLSEGEVALSFSDIIVNELDTAGFELSKKYLIYGFKFNISSRIFASFKLCSTSQENFTEYYLKLPKEILQTHLNMECK